MKILSLDTTTAFGSVALLEETRLLSEVNYELGLTHSERLLSVIDFLLRMNSLDIPDLDGFAVAVGPGSFTGIRIGMSLVKSLAMASGKPVAAVSTLNALAWKLRYPEGKLIAPALDAKKGEIYAALFESASRGLRELIPQGAYVPDRFFSLLPVRRVIHFLGSAVQLYREKILQYYQDRARFDSHTSFIAHEVGLIGYEIFKRGEGLDYHQIEPLYFRKSQAEEKDVRR